MNTLREKTGFVCDMDGVVYRGNQLLPGAREFVEWLVLAGKRFVFLTNSSERSPRELSLKLERMGLKVSEDHFHTSALATAMFLHSQRPGGSAFVVGAEGLMSALRAVGYAFNDKNPDYVVVGETLDYNYEKIEKAVLLVKAGARLIGSNPDVTGPSEQGLVPACGALIKPIEMATGAKAYFIGKPNPLIMRHALKRLGCRREETVIIGDRMDTDIIAGIESEIETCLMLTGVTQEQELPRFAYRPDHVLHSLRDIVP